MMPQLPLILNLRLVPSILDSLNFDPCECPIYYAAILRLITMYTYSAIDATLTKLAADLDDQVESGNLIIDPKYAMIHLMSSDTPVGFTIPKYYALIDISHPLQVSDYDVYGEKVNC